MAGQTMDIHMAFSYNIDHADTCRTTDNNLALGCSMDHRHQHDVHLACVAQSLDINTDSAEYSSIVSVYLSHVHYLHVDEQEVPVGYWPRRTSYSSAPHTPVPLILQCPLYSSAPRTPVPPAPTSSTDSSLQSSGAFSLVVGVPIYPVH
ncbi:hypothetical protein STEG23_003374 [Scotinomys teguina]